MFDSTPPFEQSAPIGFGPFGQCGNLFGKTAPILSPTEGSVFGGNSTGLFGTTSYSASASPLNATSCPAFRISTPAFNGTSNLSFSSSSASFSAFGQSAPTGFPQSGNLFGSTAPSLSPTEGSVFGGNSTGLFGAASYSASASPLNAMLSPAFRSSTPAFSGASNPSFSSSSASFSGSSMFGQEPTFGGFAASQPNQPLAFGSASQQTQSNFGGTVHWICSHCGASNQPQSATGTSTVAYGLKSTPAVSSLVTSPFGSTGTVFGVCTPAHLRTQSSPFGVQTTLQAPERTGISQSTFGPQYLSNRAFKCGGSMIEPYTATDDQSTQPAGKLQSISAMPFYGSKGHEELRWQYYQSEYEGALPTLPASGSTSFGQSAFGGQCGGGTVATYTATAEVDGWLQSVSAMSVHNDKSHENLRWEDYASGNKGGRGSVGQCPSGICFASSNAPSNSFIYSTSPWVNCENPSTSNPYFPKATTSSSFVSSPSLAFTCASPFTPNPFHPKARTSTSFVSSPSPWLKCENPSTSNPFFPKATTSSSFVPSPSPAFTCASPFTPNPFHPKAGTSTSFVSSPSPWLKCENPSTSNPFSPKATTSSSFVSSPSPAFTCASPFTPNPFHPKAGTSTSFVSSPPPSLKCENPSTSNPYFPKATTSSSFVSSPFLAFTCANPFTPNPFHPKAGTSTSFVSSSSPSLKCENPSTSNPFFPKATTSSSFVSSPSPAFTCASPFTPNPFHPKAGTSTSFVSSPFNFSSTSNLGTASGLSSGYSPFSTQSSQVFPATSSGNSLNPCPFFPRPTTSSSFVPSSIFSSTSDLGTASGCSSGLSPFSTQSSQVFQAASSLEQAYSSCGQSSSSFVAGNATFLSQPNMFNAPSTGSGLEGNVCSSNPSVFTQTTVHFHSADEGQTIMPETNAIFVPRENLRDVISPMENWSSRASAEKTSPLVHASSNDYENRKGSDSFVEPNVKSDLVQGASHTTVTGHRDVKALMPKLQSHEYYMEPQIQELAMKERAEPGFCSHVNDFVVGRHGYGSIKFLGETDVRQLDLYSLVQFDDREVTVYMDESSKPPVGQGLNKPAVVTLLNIKCFDNITGKLYTNGPKVDKYREMLFKAAERQGAKFVSYDPVEGEWKFKVEHFSRYEFRDDNLCEDEV